MLETDVAIIGGGPAGTTVATFLKKYNPSLDVTIVEREQFPRDHVGESHLPAISAILDEMGVWDKVEAAGFPIKIGATFKWGAKKDYWETDFLHHEKFREEARPAKFVDQRRKTAFQVDRSIYDKVLLDHAQSLGCRVFEQTKVAQVLHEGDRITGLSVVSQDPDVTEQVGSDGLIKARYYVDASGDIGILRRALGIEIEAPTALRNIAVWKYWQDATWAVTIGNGGTRIQIMSLDWGWMWFIPITPTRTSVGLVLPASYYKTSGKTTEQLYEEAIATEPLISRLLETATPEDGLFATKDWNFLAKRLAGENWFLAGDSCGFADPILSAGMTLAHTGARKVAFTILELDRNEQDPEWLKQEYEDGHRQQIRHHMQFADFWYTSNSQFTDLKEYCQEIAETAGLTLTPESAFQWLATGGFTVDEPGVAAALTYRVSGLKLLAVEMGAAAPEWELTKTNFWRLNLDGATEGKFVRYLEGRVVPIPCLKRGPKVLPIVDVFKHLLKAMKRNMDSILILEDCVNAMIREDGIPPQDAALLTIEGIESLILEGWIKGKAVPSRPFIKVT
ncbi:NAD(P)/FAD-dependent oxidoreductase [Fimbriimonas ginsengisoli]|uniref:Tryptophan halogenase n=1 Tax=Fimbriimonas ginsengisoli Gsoil 348 TaxID=661478 RepID=A0A068NQG5_FIMGI|nr:NAD(P)/FAD-dependent oxidoreductase [Fimbriimonas ginsengisoli]AIE85808.1 tryptophan halogenase [Fimbriimonas ginsengisoli Gsoil 348]